MVDTTLCYLRHAGKVLLLHRIKKKQDINAGKWIGVGGHLEAGESPLACVLREVREETGIILTDIHQVGIIDFLNTECEDERMWLYVAEVEEEITPECDEGVLAWFPENELFDLPMWEGDRTFLGRMLAGERGFHVEVSYEGDLLVGTREL